MPCCSCEQPDRTDLEFSQVTQPVVQRGLALGIALRGGRDGLPAYSSASVMMAISPAIKPEKSGRHKVHSAAAVEECLNVGNGFVLTSYSPSSSASVSRRPGDSAMSRTRPENPSMNCFSACSGSSARRSMATAGNAPVAGWPSLSSSDQPGREGGQRQNCSSLRNSALGASRA